MQYDRFIKRNKLVIRFQFFRIKFLGFLDFFKNLRCLAIHSFTGKAQGVDPEDESGAGAPKAVQFGKHCRFGSYLATKLAPNIITSVTVPMDFVSVMKC